MVWLGQSMFNVIGLTDQIETHLAEGDAVAIAGLLSELDAVVRCPAGYCDSNVPRGGEDRMDAVGGVCIYERPPVSVEFSSGQGICPQE